MTKLLVKLLVTVCALAGAAALSPAAANAQTWLPGLLEQGQGIAPGSTLSSSAPDCIGSTGVCPAVHNDPYGDTEIGEYVLAFSAFYDHLDSDYGYVPITGYVGSSSSLVGSSRTAYVFLYNPTFNLYFAYSGTVDEYTYEVTDVQRVWVSIYNL
ncbi:hypothetical protein OJ997_01115 [Solirubrobacter phytolaccae]|uniref:Uncharacterized protein n=1 Tax=Solirubrobacter phytolaccae TaxID=1404360 RepID=A0A9X3SCD1_9ACTN|nr:hypothetical protein [Solirubrobacter phytolaccae]MDA0178877.1 hypothetical protein [Solirubrobacter phytolaccae]